MMSKKQWFVVLCIFILYLLLGAGIFHIIESVEEENRIFNQIQQKNSLLDKISQLFEKTPKQEKNKFLLHLEEYCGKPFSIEGGEPLELWDFYHSLFFVITVVSTIGYGNLAPTTMFTRIFMIFYGLIGIPMNGIVMVTLGTYFGRSFTKLYKRWKSSKNTKVEYNTKLGLISQVILYLIPGFTFFIFLPSALMVIFEGWEYDVAVYYCFVTLTTIGFGDYVAGVQNANNFQSVPYWLYKIFLLIWVIGGLGYVVMILGFITKALQSKKMHEFEQMIKNNIKKTPVKIRQELRGLLQEFLFMKVKTAYKNEFDYIPKQIQRTQSCPDLNIYRNVNSPTTARKRAFSECPYHLDLMSGYSESTLDFHRSPSFHESEDYSPQSELLQKVVDALSFLEDRNEITDRGYDGFSDNQILASERFGGSKWSLKSQNYPPQISSAQRRRAISDVRVPSFQRVEAHNDTWYGQEAASNLETLFRTRTASEPTTDPEKSPRSFLTRIKNRFISSREDKNDDVEQNRKRDSVFTPAEDRYFRQTSRGRASVLSIQQQEAVLEQTSIADFIRALSAITGQETIIPANSSPKRKLGVAGFTPPTNQSPPRTRRLGIRSNLQARRPSLMPDTNVVVNERRRFSLRPVEENLLVPPPPYSPKPPEDNKRAMRRFSRTLNTPTVTISPVQRQVNKRENKDDDKPESGFF